jgi:mono/diheme cytochrome c family protein
MKTLKNLLLLLAFVAAVGLGWLYGGGFNAAADAPHSKLVYWLFETARQRSIDVRSSDIPVPPLDDLQKIAAGAAEYSEMCEGCHRAPGKKSDEEFLGGLYPRPPDLTQPSGISAAAVFWAIKHGIKMSAMPAWGLSHDDATLWTLVAFVRKLPTLSAAQYAELTTHAAEGHAAAHDAAPSSDSSTEAQHHAAD